MHDDAIEPKIEPPGDFSRQTPSILYTAMTSSSIRMASQRMILIAPSDPQLKKARSSARSLMQLDSSPKEPAWGISRDVAYPPNLTVKGIILRPDVNVNLVSSPYQNSRLFILPIIITSTRQPSFSNPFSSLRSLSRRIVRGLNLAGLATVPA